MDTGLSDRNLGILAKNCQRAREKAGLHPEDVSAILEKSSGYIYQLERASFNPPLAILLQLRRQYKLKNLEPLVRGLK